MCVTYVHTSQNRYKIRKHERQDPGCRLKNLLLAQFFLHIQNPSLPTTDIEQQLYIQNMVVVVLHNNHCNWTLSLHEHTHTHTQILSLSLSLSLSLQLQLEVALQVKDPQALTVPHLPLRSVLIHQISTTVYHALSFRSYVQYS